MRSKFLVSALAILGILIGGWVQAQTVNFAWDTYVPLAGTTVDGFRLYQSSVSGQYTYGAANAKATIQPNTVTTYSLTGVPDGRWYFVLTAFGQDSTGVIGDGSPSNEVMTIVDTIAPIITAFTIPATSNILTVPITSLIATDATGVTGYMVKENATVPLVTDAGWSATAPTSFTFTTKGAKTLYAWAKDGYNHVSLSKSAVVTITPTAPKAPTGFRVAP